MKSIRYSFVAPHDFQLMKMYEPKDVLSGQYMSFAVLRSDDGSTWNSATRLWSHQNADDSSLPVSISADIQGWCFVAGWLEVAACLVTFSAFRLLCITSSGFEAFGLVGFDPFPKFPSLCFSISLLPCMHVASCSPNPRRGSDCRLCLSWHFLIFSLLVSHHCRLVLYPDWPDRCFNLPLCVC